MYLGYEPMGKQFKVLCMTMSPAERPNTHQVLTLESGKHLWRRVEHKFHFVRNQRMWGDICIDGVLYFGAAVGKSSMIVCFDVRSEKFSFINTNEDMGLESPCFGGSLTLFNYKSQLGIRQRDNYHFSGAKEIVLWVLEDAGNHKWSKHSYVLSRLGSEIVTRNWFLGMTSTCEVVYSSKLCVFFSNIAKNSVKRVNIQGPEELEHPRICDTFVNYVENMKFM